jgi:hypothetical protein
MLIVAAMAFWISKILYPDSIMTPLLAAGVAFTAVGSAAAFFSGWLNTAQLVDSMSSSGFLGGGNYKKKYLEYMFFRHRNFDVKGLTTQGVYTLELSRVFVELSVAPRIAQNVLNNPIKVPRELQKGSHSIWSYLALGNREAPNFAIIGVPGSGKTTMLKHMTLALIGKARGQKYKLPKKLPILLYLRDHAQHIAEDRRHIYSLEDAIQNDLNRWDKVAPTGWFTNELNKGNCLVMLDGLDEVADLVVRLKVVQWVDRQLVAYPRNSFIITSRPHGYRSNPLRDVTILEVESFTSKQQINFVQNWYLANEIQSQQKDDEGVRIDAKEGADDLLQRLYQSPKLAELAVNPLLLTMIATVHKYRSSLPSRRVELYAEICEVFLGKRQQSKGLQLDLTPEQRKRVLQPLAWHMMENKVRDVSKLEAEQIIQPTLKSVQHYADAEIFLKNIENDSGLLIERESGRYSFAHLTFQEFLSAEHVRDQPHLLDSLLTHVKESWWHEVLLLYVARADATPVIETCLAIDDAEDVNSLLLAVACMDEAREVDPETQVRLEQMLAEALNGQDPQRVGFIAKACLQQRVQNVIRIDEKQAVDVSLLTNAEYQLFINDALAQGKRHVPAHWSENHYPAGRGSLSVLGVSIKDVKAFCAWLTDLLNDGYHYTIPLKIEAKHIPMEVDSEISCAGYWVRSKKGHFVEMVVGQPATVSLNLLNQYRERVLGIGVRMDHAQTVAKRHKFDLNLALLRYLDEARRLDLRIAANNSDVSNVRFPGVRYIEQAGKLNKQAVKRELNPDLMVCLALVKDLESEYGHDLGRDLSLLLLVAGVLLSRLRFEEEKLNWTVSNKQAYKEWKDFAIKLVRAYTTAFVNLCIVAERKKGNLEPFEGIRLMRIRKDL